MVEAKYSIEHHKRGMDTSIKKSGWAKNRREELKICEARFRTRKSITDFLNIEGGGRFTKKILGAAPASECRLSAARPIVG